MSNQALPQPLRDAVDGESDLFRIQLLEARVRELETERDQLREDAVDTGHLGVWNVNLVTRVVRTNARHDELFGYTEPVPWWGLDAARQHLLPEDRQALAAAFARAMRTGELDLRVRVRWPDGSVHRVHSRGRVTRDERGRAIRIAGVTLEVTGLDQAEEQLRRSHETFFSLVQNSPFGVYIIDSAFRMRQVSAGSQNVFRGVHPLIGRDFAEVLRAIWTEPFASDAIARFRHTLETGETYHARNTTEQRSNIDEVESYDWKIERITLPDGQFGVVCYFYDLTERNQAAAALATERSKLATVIESLPLGVGIGDTTGKTLSLNRAGLALHGFSDPAEMLVRLEDYSQSFELRRMDGGVMPLEDWPASRAIRGDFVRGLELRLLNRAAGVERVVSYDVVPVRDGEGTVTLLVYVIQDLTERKQAEAALREAKDAAERASQAKSQFLAVMSHELRTPLTGVIGYADLLDTQVLGPVSDRQQDAISRIKTSSWHLVSIIDEILTLSRVEAGKEEVNVQPTDVAEISRDVVRILEPEAARRTLGIEVQNAEEPGLASTDQRKVRQILINLVGNAVKYTRQGQVTVQVDRSTAGRIRVHVRDTGPGIAPDDQERIFEPFIQIDGSHTRGESGTGLGLAICRKLARLLGGDVTVESVPGAGSVFTLDLPVQA